MSENDEKRGQGRPSAVIDWNKVEQMIILGANGVQVAASLGIHPDTLYLRCQSDLNTVFSVYYHEKREKGNLQLHATQFEVAVKTKNPSMLIWLGKQRLGQKDKDEESVTNPELFKQFEAFMKMMHIAQSGSKSSLNIESTESKSE